MFFIWGIGTRRKLTNVYVKEICGQCGTTQNMNILTQYGCATLFFVPIIKMNRKYFVVCPHCSASKQISKAEFKTIKNRNKNGLVFETKDIVVNKTETKLVESKQDEKLIATPLKEEIVKEIDSIIKKLNEKNFVLTSEKVGKFKVVLKEQLLKKFNDEELINVVIEEYFKNTNN